MKENVKDKLFEELKNNPINEKSEPTFHDYAIVIKETLRMYPPALILGRKVDEDILLPRQKFGMLEMKVLLSMIVLKYYLLLATQIEKITLELGVVLLSLEPILVRIKSRKL
ncbi:hypothetical protein PGB90_002204 [Kerria lacca]